MSRLFAWLCVETLLPLNWLLCSPALETWSYNFVAHSSGTYWYHSHAHAQYMDGLYGPMVVTDPAEPKYAVDNVLAVSDWQVMA